MMAGISASDRARGHRRVGKGVVHEGLGPGQDGRGRRTGAAPPGCRSTWLTRPTCQILQEDAPALGMHRVGHHPPACDLRGRVDAGCVLIALRLRRDLGRLGDDQPGTGALGVIFGGEGPGTRPAAARLRVKGAMTIRWPVSAGRGHRVGKAGSGSSVFFLNLVHPASGNGTACFRTLSGYWNGAPCPASGWTIRSAFRMGLRLMPRGGRGDHHSGLAVRGGLGAGRCAEAASGSSGVTEAVRAAICPNLQCGRSGRVLIRAQVAAGRMAVLHDLILALQGVLMICISNRVKAMMMIDII